MKLAYGVGEGGRQGRRERELADCVVNAGSRQAERS